MSINIAKLKAAAPYQSRFSRLWERFDEASHGNAEHMRDILEVTLDALETAERHIFKADRETLELISALEAKDAQIAELDERLLRYAGIATRRAEHVAELEKRIAELEARTLRVTWPDDGLEDCEALWGTEHCRDTFDCGYNFSASRHEQAVKEACAAAGINLETGRE